MPSADNAADHLRTIRSLMERATVYRALAGTGALFGGSLALLVGGLMLWKELVWEPSNLEFAGVWLAVMVVVSAVNFWLLYRGAQQRGEVFISPGMKHALRALAPGLWSGLILSLLFATTGPSAPHAAKGLMAALWATGYGVALLGTVSFAPRSMQVLGAAFFVLGLGFCQRALAGPPSLDYCQALRTMILGFGGLHLLYGLWVVLSSRSHPTPADS